MIWYPSVGSSDYPYTPWNMKRREYAWEYLKRLGEGYFFVCSQLRNKYMWPPIVFETMEVSQIVLLFEEALEAQKKEEKEFTYG